MKKTILILSLVFSFSLLQAQPYVITFTGSGESETVENIIVQNLTQGTELTMPGSSELHLIEPIFVKNYQQMHENLQIYPNPMNESAKLVFYIHQNSDVNIEVFDISAKLIFKTTHYLVRGNHEFEINGLASGVYTVKVGSKYMQSSTNLVSVGQETKRPSIKKTGVEHIENPVVLKQKSLKSTFEMEYNEGDRLLFKGISGDYSTIAIHIADSDHTIDFEFVECTDAESNNYSVVKIGEQVWMAENLRYLPAVSPPGTGSESESHAYVYEYDGTNVSAAKATENYQIYGVLYNWSAAKVVCPAGWTLPSNTDWTELTEYLIANGYNYDGTTEGNKIGKSLSATSYWTTHTTAGAVGNDLFANNSSGFSALPAGSRTNSGNFSYIELQGNWWSSTADSETNARARDLYYGISGLISGSSNKASAYSVRCIKRACPPTIDYEGYTYNTIQIEEQCWLAENLRYLPEVVGPATGSNSEPHYYVHGYNGTSVFDAKASPNYQTYGVLYNWNAAITACPDGWHLPTDDDWKKLEMYLGMSQAQADEIGWRGTNEGSKLAGNASLWNDGALIQDADFNSSGFAAIPGCARSDDGTFCTIGQYFFWWSASEIDADKALHRYISWIFTKIWKSQHDKEYGLSVRCIKD